MNYIKITQEEYWNLTDESGRYEVYDQGGSKEYLLNGNRHREDGPSVIHVDGTINHHIHDELHRTDGPAVVHPDKTKDYYLNGMYYDKDGFVKLLTGIQVKRFILNPQNF